MDDFRRQSTFGERLMSFVREERGASLVEMLVAVAISVMVIGIITTSVVQFMLVNRWGNDQLLVSSDLQVASLWLGRDGPEARAFTPDTVDPNEYGTFSWVDQNLIQHQHRYYYDPGKGDLVREYLRGGVPQSTLSVARRIAAAGDITFAVSGDLVTVTITSTSGEVSETAEINLALRSD